MENMVAVRGTRMLCTEIRKDRASKESANGTGELVGLDDWNLGARRCLLSVSLLYVKTVYYREQYADHQCTYHTLTVFWGSVLGEDTVSWSHGGLASRY